MLSPSTCAWMWPRSRCLAHTQMVASRRLPRVRWVLLPVSGRLPGQRRGGDCTIFLCHDDEPQPSLERKCCSKTAVKAVTLQVELAAPRLGSGLRSRSESGSESGAAPPMLNCLCSRIAGGRPDQLGAAGESRSVPAVSAGVCVDARPVGGAAARAQPARAACHAARYPGGVLCRAMCGGRVVGGRTGRGMGATACRGAFASCTVHGCLVVRSSFMCSGHRC